MSGRSEPPHFASSFTMTPSRSNLGWVCIMLFVPLVSGCGDHVQNSRPAVIYKKVAYARQSNTETPARTYDEAFDEADRKFKIARKTLGIEKIKNDFIPPPIQYYLDPTGSDCDKWYFDGTSATHCAGAVEPETNYTTQWRTDGNNTEMTTEFQMLLIQQEVIADDPTGFLLGVTSPRTPDPTVTSRASYVFDSQIKQWLNKASTEHSCGYQSGGRPGYLKYMVNWTVAHELGRQIGGLNAVEGHAFEHKGTEHDDIMGKLDDCDPENQYYKEFCREPQDDHIPNNSCVERLQNVP